MPLKLHLFHGRTDPKIGLDDWGSDGPTLENIEWVHTTYLTHIRMKFTDKTAYDTAQGLTGWIEADYLVLEVHVYNEMIEANWVYYGDWSIGGTTSLEEGNRCQQCGKLLTANQTSHCSAKCLLLASTEGQHEAN